MTRVLGWCLLLTALSSVACAAEMDAPVGNAEAELFGGLEIRDCEPDQAHILRNAWNIGKVAAKDPAFEQCILDSPYVPCDDDDDPRKTTAVAVTRSPNVTALQCRDFSDSETGGQAGPTHGALHDSKEELSVSRRVFSLYTYATLKVRAEVFSDIIWHEVSHTHGFQHGTGTDETKYAKQCGRDSATWDYESHSMPYIISDCMADTVAELVNSRFVRYLGREATEDEEDRFFALMADGTISTGVQLTHAILHLDAPSNLRTGNVNGTSIALSWNDNSFNETYFQVSGTQGFSSVIAPRAGANATTVTVQNLTPATSYRFWIKACHASGCSDKSNEITVTTRNTLPSVPQNFRVTGTGTEHIALQWQHTNGTNARTSYRLTYTGGSISGWRDTTLGASATGYIVRNLEPNESYQFHLRACNADGCSNSVSTVGTTPRLAPLPAAASNLRVTSSTPTTINLAWNDNAPLIVDFNEQLHFELDWALATTGGGGQGGANLIWSTIVLSGRQTTYAFPVNVPTIHYFRVRTCNIGGCASPSNQVSRSP